MLKDHFIRLFKYNDWATKEAATVINNTKQNEKRVYELLPYIVNAQRIWLNRVQQKNIFPDPWEEHSAKECIEYSAIITSDWINFISGMDDADLERIIKYKNNKGEDCKNTIKDIVMHIINHSTYHRAQIAQLIRQSGGQPPKTDYIAYQREFQK